MILNEKLQDWTNLCGSYFGMREREREVKSKIVQSRERLIFLIYVEVVEII